MIGDLLPPFVTPRSRGGFVMDWTSPTALQHFIMREYGVSGVPSGPSQLLSLDEVRPILGAKTSRPSNLAMNAQ